MNKPTKLDLHEKIDLGVRCGVARALAEHKKTGGSIVVWQDGQVVTIPADKIQVDKTFTKQTINL